MRPGWGKRVPHQRRTHPWHETKIMRDDLLRVVAHDAFPVDYLGQRLPLPADFVMGVGGATRTLLDLLPQRHVGRALDLGCGSGAITAFLDADRVIATDIDTRALEAAAVTCHISGFRQLEPHVWRDGTRIIEFRQGSLFGPVPGQRFDLIASNPPFVISGSGHTHRDSPLPADGLTRELLGALPEHLNSGGRAVVLATWLHPRGLAWQEHVRSMLPAEQVRVWVAQREVLDLDAYVEVWGDDAALPGDVRAAWRERLEALDAEAVGFGWIVMDRSTSPWIRIEDVSTASRVPRGHEVDAQMQAFSLEPTVVQLLHGPLRFDGVHWRGNLALDPFQAALLERVHEGSTLADAVDAVSTSMPVDADDLLAHALIWARRSTELGYLRLAG